MSTNPKLRTSPLRSFLWALLLLASTITAAQAEDEFGSGGGGGGYYGEVVVLPPFVVDGNDPATFDYEGAAAYEAQRLEDAIDGANNKYNESQFSDTCLMPSETSGYNGGWVESAGYGGRVNIVINISNPKVFPYYLQTSAVKEILIESIKIHETTHINDAIRDNPGVFNTTIEGLVLSIAENAEDAYEIAAYQSQLNYLKQQMQNPTLSDSDKDALNEVAVNCEQQIRDKGGKPQ